MVLKAYKQDDKYFLERRKEGFDKSKFEIVGSPSITEDGIASNLDKDNKFLLPSLDLQNKTFKIKGRVKFNDLTPTRNTIFGSTVDGGLPLLVLETSKPKLYLNSKDVADSYNIQKTANYTIETETWYDIELVVDGVNAILKFNNNEIVNTLYSGIKFETTNMRWILGSHVYLSNFAFKGSNDLKVTEIEIDNKEIFNGQIDKYYALQT